MENRVTEFGKEMYTDKYLLPDESLDGLYRRVSDDNCRDSKERADRIVGYFQKKWFHSSTPVTSNSGTERGDPISCFTAETPDSMEGIMSGYAEDFILSSKGGGIGRKKIMRSVGETIGKVGKSSGKIPFYKIDDAMTRAISQGNLRRGSKAEYIDISDPEVEEFINIRKPTGGDSSRKCFNLHHGVMISDGFMEAVINDTDWDLVSVKDGSVVKTVRAYDLFSKILTARIETGEPYIVYEGNVNNNVPELYRLADYKVKLSNLCVEIMLHTSASKTAVCCLSSVNLERYDEWKDDALFIEDVMYFLDGVLEQYLEKIDNSPEWQRPWLQKVKNFVLEERAVGLGVMGWHGLLQQKGIPFESPIAKGLNIKIFKELREKVDKASVKIAQERGPCDLAKRFNKMERFTHKIAIAPTASISILCGEATAGVEPRQSNSYVHKNGTKAHTVRNRYLEKIIEDKAAELEKDGRWVSAQWKSILANEGSVQHLDWMDDYTKEVFKTAFEIDQRFIIEQAADRQQFIDQSQSINLFLKHDIHKNDLLGLHLMAWKSGVKSLYYCRSTAAKRATVGGEVKRDRIKQEYSDFTECLSCQ